MMELTAADGHTFSCYRSDPPNGSEGAAPKGAVVVLQEVFGVNQDIRNVADSFAAHGYTAFAPALFDRVKRGVELRYDERGQTEGLEVARQAGEEGTLADIQATVNAASSAGKVAVVGYSWGGYLSFLSGNQVSGLVCAVGYCGLGIVDTIREKRRIPTLLHFGESDRLIPYQERVTLFRARRPDVTVYSYHAGHGFNFEGRDSYDEPSAQLALERTLALISQYVVGAPPAVLKNAGFYLSQKGDKKKKPAATANAGPPE